MHSSISNSEPIFRLRVVALAAALVIVATASVETFWRARGHRTSITSNLDLWAQQRDRIYGRNKLVLLGGSRILLGYSFDESRRLLPKWEPVQLAVGARLPAAVLRDLSNDTNFGGVVLLSIRGEAFERRTWGSQQQYVDHYHRSWSVSRKLDRWLLTQVESNLVSARESLGLDRIASKLDATGALPRPYFIDVASNRETRARFGPHYVRPAPGRVRAHMERHFQISAASAPDEWLESALELDGWIQRISARGGRVALLRFPGSGEYLHTTSRYYPRTQYWDRLAARTLATTVHFADVEAMASLPLPDDLHVDAGDRDTLTRALLSELKRKGFFD